MRRRRRCATTSTSPRIISARRLAGADWLRFDRDRYQINAGVGGVIDFDASTFERQVGDELRRARRGQINIDSLRAALATYRSAFADGEPYGDWHLEVRDQLARLHADGLETLGEALLNAERYDEAAPVFERLIRQEELHEDAYRALMICRARAQVSMVAPSMLLASQALASAAAASAGRHGIKAGFHNGGVIGGFTLHDGNKGPDGLAVCLHFGLAGLDLVVGGGIGEGKAQAQHDGTGGD